MVTSSDEIWKHGLEIGARADKLALMTPRVKLEQYYQTLIENILQAGHCHIPGIGFTDITLANAHIEIKNSKNYAMTAGQMLKYYLAAPREYRVVILFGRLTVSTDFLRTFFAHTIVTHALWFDEFDNLHPIFKCTGTTSPYFA